MELELLRYALEEESIEVSISGITQYGVLALTLAMLITLYHGEKSEALSNKLLMAKDLYLVGGIETWEQ
jgi:hypothetical protein